MNGYILGAQYSMRFHYRITDDREVEIVRCFGRDPKIDIPQTIGGMPVTRMAPYAFSARKEKEDGGVLVCETEEESLFGDRESLLAGELVGTVVLPDGMKELGRYLFYGCRDLSELRFTDSLENIGSGAFTGCRSLRRLEVRLLAGDRSCVPDILGDLWQRIDVTFRKQEEESRFIFPEHYEEAVENTPARILFTQHHGSGNNYRQCFYERKIDPRKYDELFYSARAQEEPDVTAQLALLRLMYPVELTREAQQAYEDYIRENAAQTAALLIDREDMQGLGEMSRRRLWTQDALALAVEHAAKTGRREALSYLMEERRKVSGGARKQTKYEL